MVSFKDRLWIIAGYSSDKNLHDVWVCDLP
ncbi:MAG: hypothetical protein GF331_06995 [Chitinivibrionales bacterium]|nr:hypothetical protein [Chitinivibrionales bacterium]